MAIILNPSAVKNPETVAVRPEELAIEAIPWIDAPELQKVSTLELAQIGFALAQALPKDHCHSSSAWGAAARLEAVSLSRY